MIWLFASVVVISFLIIFFVQQFRWSYQMTSKLIDKATNNEDGKAEEGGLLSMQQTLAIYQSYSLLCLFVVFILITLAMVIIFFKIITTALS